MERKEAYEQIKKLGLQEECKKQFGKNFTQCKTNELEVIIKKKKKKEESKAGTEVKTTEITTETATKTVESKNSFNKLLDILKKRHILLESDVKDILG